LLDDDRDGIIKYDISRLSEPISQFENPEYDSSDTIILNFDQFIEIMVRKIINHKKRFEGKIVFESGMIVCKYKKPLVYHVLYVPASITWRKKMLIP
jgi:hypothetical protein